MISIPAIAAVALAATAADARALAPTKPEILALVVASNRGAEVGRPPLAYADDDAAKYHALFSALAGEDGTVVLTEFDSDSARLFPTVAPRALAPTRANLAEVAARFARRAAQAREAARPVELYFVYAGHGDVEGGEGYLELADGRFTARDLEALVERIGATESHVILDSCNSFFVVNPRKPGGRRFATPSDAAASLSARLPNVGVLLSTSAEAEVYEWSELQSGIFSHAVRSGLMGAADANADGKVTYRELAAFVETASAGVKNPLFRPKVFARGPAGDDTRTVFDLTLFERLVLQVDETGPVRLALRDADGLRWLDAHKEAGATMRLTVPTALAARFEVERLRLDRAEGSSAVEARFTLAGAEDSPVALATLPELSGKRETRGAGDVFRGLFTMPFGPAALAAWTEQRTKTPEPVYGVSQEDSERMRLVLGELAGAERDRRYLLGTTGILVGVGLGTWGTLAILKDPNTEPNAGRNLSLGVMLASSAYIVGTGIYSLLRTSQAERTYEHFSLSLSDPSANPEQVLAQTERDLEGILSEKRSLKLRATIGGACLAALAAAAAVLNETGNLGSPTTPRDANRPVFIGMAAFGLGLILDAQFSDTAPERIIQLWREDPASRRLPRVSVAPVPGGGMLSLSGVW